MVQVQARNFDFEILSPSQGSRFRRFLLVASLDVIRYSKMAPLKTAPFPGGQVDVTSPDVAGLTLVTPLPLYARVYIGPWLIAYPLAAYAFYGNYDKYIKSIGR